MSKLLTLISLFFLLCNTAGAETYISDSFDAQDDWNPTVCDGVDPERIPPDPWAYVLCDTILYIDSTAAYGGSGKGFGINWTQGMNEAGLHAPTSVLSGKSDIWVGFRFKHNSGWDWGTDTTYKWFRWGAEGDTINMNYDQNHRVIIGDSLLKSNIPFSTSDDSWHTVIIYLKHNTLGSSDGQMRMWWDGVEVTWSIEYGTISDNLSIPFNTGYSVWPAKNLAWGYQSRPGWGAENVAFWDDIIVASTEAEVLAFTGSSVSAEATTIGSLGAGSKVGMIR